MVDCGQVPCKSEQQFKIEFKIEQGASEVCQANTWKMPVMPVMPVIERQSSRKVLHML